MSYRYDYTKSMMMKLFLAEPDRNGGSRVYCDFGKALEIIKILDSVTLGVHKIIYLVGWQYLGHDDRYPKFFEVNRFAAGTETAEEAREKLLWLIKEAKKYHTVLSLHINFSDAYEESGLWDEYLKNDLIVKNSKGQPRVTGEWNSRKAYQVLFSKEYESGYFQKRADKLLSLLPFEEIKTLHADAFFVNPGKGVSIKKEKEYRRKMIEYFSDRGVDITSEFIYRERAFGFRSQWGKSDIIGYIPAVWNLRMTQRDFLKKVYFDNPSAVYRHFGDIDAGGLYIHEHLCRVTGIPFRLYRMSREQLEDPYFQSCLHPLTEQDRVRLQSLEKQEAYRELAGYMLKRGVKLEQEIVSWWEQQKEE